MPTVTWRFVRQTDGSTIVMEPPGYGSRAVLVLPPDCDVMTAACRAYDAGYRDGNNAGRLSEINRHRALLGLDDIDILPD